MEGGISIVRFEDDLVSGQFEQIVLEAYAEAVSLGVPWTPFLLINGQPYTIETTLINLEQAVRLAWLQTRTYTEYPPMEIDIQGEYIAHLHLSIGEVVIQLLPESAPLAVNSFVFLASNPASFNDYWTLNIKNISLICSNVYANVSEFIKGYRTPIWTFYIWICTC